MEDFSHWLLFAALAVLVCESIISSRWPRWYSAYGIPVYFSSNVVQTSAVSLPSTEALKNDPRISLIEKSIPVDFRALSDGSIAFRTRLTLKLFALYVILPMRGVMRFNHERNAVQIVGLLNWWFLMLNLDFIFSLFYPIPMPYSNWKPDPIIPSLIGFSLGLIAVYTIQRGQFKRIMEAAVSLV